IPAMKRYAGNLRLELAQYRELEAFSQFASDLDKSTRDTLNRGARLVELLKQAQYEPLDVALQVASIRAGTSGVLDHIEVSEVGKFEKEMHAWLRDKRPALLDEIRGARKKDELAKVETDLDEALGAFKKTFKA
ncbi:MAG: F0F1 ATP synthase subunit alpha, partial [Deltaproteobacteria bacterium]|nr:F0F1 ATP synthase subunit alpha [Nannocystaceae bacterium]